MCVIILCEKEFPSLDTLKSAEAMNGHGGGISWVGSSGLVSYRKSLDAEEIYKITKEEATLPAIIHFRIASVGGVVDELCHPFPITDEVSLDLYGECESVLFHNGTWGEWKEHMLSVVKYHKMQIPDGVWSDSRCMAYMANHFGKNILHLIGGKTDKIAILSINGIERFGSGWVTVKKNVCSNNYFDMKDTFKDTTTTKKDKKKDKKGLDSYTYYGTADEVDKLDNHTFWGSMYDEPDDDEYISKLDRDDYDSIYGMQRRYLK